MYYKAGSTILFFLIALQLFSQERQDFDSIITKAIASGKKDIQIPKGTYYLQLKDYKPLTLENLDNVTINCNGSEIICKKTTQAIQISNCKNLTLAGFSIDYDPLPFTEGEIVDMDKAKRMWLRVKIYDGYPVENIEKTLPDRFQIFDKQTLELKRNLFTYWPNNFSKVEKRGDRTYVFYKSHFIKESCEEIGDKIVFSMPSPSSARPHGIITDRSEDITFKNITLYSSNCFGFFEDECSRNSYLNCVITKKSGDKRVAFPRLRSANADALHSKSAKLGPLIENCTFQYNGDDDIAINSRFYIVVSGDHKDIYVAAKKEELKIESGDSLRFVNSDGSVKCDAIAISVTESPGFDSERIKKAITVYNKAHPDDEIVTRITLNKGLDSVEGTLVYSLSRAGSGFVVRNNQVGFTRARGILIKASNGIIEKNIVDGCELAGIVLAPEMSWMEAVFSRNVVMRNNTIRNCMFANSSYGIEQVAPVSVVAVNAKGKIAPAGGFRNLYIEGNRIENCPMPAMIITSASNTEISNNKISASKTIVRKHGQSIGVNNKQVIWASDTIHVKMTNNEILNLKVVKY